MPERNAQQRESITSIDRLWIEDPGLMQLLEESSSVDEARDLSIAYLEDHEADLLADAYEMDRVERAVALDWTRALREMFSASNEAVAGFSTLEQLRRLAQGEGEDLSEGFVQEFVHALRAAQGAAGVSKGWLRSIESHEWDPEAFPQSGRKRALARSEDLDCMNRALEEGLAKHPSGLREDMARMRAGNRERILDRLGGTSKDWNSPDWQFSHVLRGETGLGVLRDLAVLSSAEAAASHLAVRYGLPWGITPYYLSLFDLGSSSRLRDAQVRAQVIPPLHTVRSMIDHRSDRHRAFDFMRERDTSPMEHVTRRYPSVAILKVCDVCPQVCVYCQRNWELGDAMAVDRIPSFEELEPALAWFEAHDAIRDVLITGGDPLILPDKALCELLSRLARMEHVRHIRIGTRIPVTMPMRITEDFAALLGAHIEPGRRTISLVTHVESALEVTADLAAAVSRLRRRGVRVYNQQVMTLEASRRFCAVATRIALVEAGVDPYYTFYTKGKDEHRDYLVPIARILQERKEEARLLPGIFRTDEPVFNVPGLGKSHLRARQDRELIGVRADGRRVYLFHPWEKGIVPVSPWSYVDVSIGDYLSRLTRLGEDPEAYESIWYYI